MDLRSLKKRVDYSFANVCIFSGIIFPQCISGSSVSAFQVLMVDNLGDDADTKGAVYRQSAWAYNGEEGIPVGWTEYVAMREQIMDLADRRFSSASTGSNHLE